MKKDITTVNVSQPDYAGKLNHKELKIIGEIDLRILAELVRHDFDFLDISEAEFGIDEEKWSVCLGWSHCGPVYGSSGWRDVEVLKRFLEEINAKAILLPDNVQRRHINAAKKNPTHQRTSGQPELSPLLLRRRQTDEQEEDQARFQLQGLHRNWRNQRRVEYLSPHRRYSSQRRRSRNSQKAYCRGRN